MKYLFLLTILSISGVLHSQSLNPTSVSISYFGETITHPGLKVGVDYELGSWQKSTTWKSGKSKMVRSSISVSANAGFFYHKDYQTGLFVIPEAGYTRKKANGNFVTYGLGAGYMRTIVPDVYESNPEGEFVKTSQGYNYFLANYSVAFGKDLSVSREIPMDIFVKPQLMSALPGVTGGVAYFAVELGVKYRL
jgi:hypothetical protein